MGRIRVSTVIDASPAGVWSVVERVEDHVDWMADASAIRLLSRQRRGVGTRFECDTRVGPFTLTDEMEITEWRDGRAMGVRHSGVVTGTGRFTLRRARGGRTRFRWDERLAFPWWMGGPLGGVVGGQLMRLIWKRNLRTLKALIERAQPAGGGPAGAAAGGPGAKTPGERRRAALPPPPPSRLRRAPWRRGR